MDGLIILITEDVLSVKQGLGDWGFGDWGWGIGDWAQSPIPNPQSPIPNPQSPCIAQLLLQLIQKVRKIKYHRML